MISFDTLNPVRRVITHYRSALGAILRNRWLVAAPFLIAVSQSVLSMPMTRAMLHRRPEIDPSLADHPAFRLLSPSLLVSGIVHQSIPALKDTLRSSTLPAALLIDSSFPVALFTVVALTLLVFKPKPDWFKDLAQTAPRGLRTVKRVAAASVALFILGVLAYFISPATVFALNPLSRAVIIYMPGLALVFSAVWVIVLLEAFYFYTAIEALERRRPFFRDNARKTVESFWPLYVFSGILVAIIMAAHAVGFLIMGHKGEGALQTYIAVRDFYLLPAIRTLTATGAFLLVVVPIRASQVWTLQWTFFRTHIATTVLFVVSGGLLLSVSVYLEGLVGMVITPYSLPSYDVGFALTALRWGLMSWYTVAFLDWVRSENSPR